MELDNKGKLFWIGLFVSVGIVLFVTAILYLTDSELEDSNPKEISIASTIENPSIQSIPGSPVTVTWELTDPDSNSKGTKTEQIVDGDERTWNFDLNFPEQGLHELIVTIDQGQDRININHLVDILYEQEESSPNPYQSENESEDEDSESE